MEEESPRYALWSALGLVLGLIFALFGVLAGVPNCGANPGVRSAAGDLGTMPAIPERIPKNRLAQMQRGWYLASVGGCAACHTPTDAITGPRRNEALSGGVAFRSKVFGTIYSANITADRSSGLGKARDRPSQLRSALRGGLSTHGQNMQPSAMPWHQIGQVNTEDLDCLLLYLSNSFAVSRPMPQRAAPQADSPDGLWMGFGSWANSM